MFFSIIIPAYNVEKYIETCILSLFMQKFHKDQYEILVVNDCSTDNTEAILLDLKSKILNLKIINHQNNKHQGGARNTGLKYALGEYIMFVDGDDCLIYDNTLTELHSILTQYPTDILRAKYYTPVKNTFTLTEIPQYVPQNICWMTTNEYMRMDCFALHVHSACYKRDFLIRNSLFFEENLFYEDTPWTFKAYASINKFLLVDFAFYGYRQNDSSITRSPSVDAFQDNVKSWIITERLFDCEIQDPLMHEIVRKIFRKSLYGFLKISRFYPIKDSLKCLRILKKQKFAFRSYSQNLVDWILFGVMKYCPELLIMPIKLGYNLKKLLK